MTKPKFKFVSNETRDLVIEECAKAAEDAIPSIRESYGVAETVGAHIAARYIRALKSVNADDGCHKGE